MDKCVYDYRTYSFNGLVVGQILKLGFGVISQILWILHYDYLDYIQTVFFVIATTPNWDWQVGIFVKIEIFYDLCSSNEINYKYNIPW